MDDYPYRWSPPMVPPDGPRERPSLLIRNHDIASPEPKALDCIDPQGDVKTLDPASLSHIYASDRILLANRHHISDKASTYQATPTPSIPHKGAFYHEKQDGGQCGIHAANAFLGQRTVLPSALSAFNRESYGAHHNAPMTNFLEEYKDEAPDRYIDATGGNNPATLHGYLLHLAHQDKIDPRYHNTGLSMLSHDGSAQSMATHYSKQLEQHTDRVILGMEKPSPHFIAFRHHQETGWVKIDSENAQQEKTTPTDFIQTLPAQPRITFILEK